MGEHFLYRETKIIIFYFSWKGKKCQTWISYSAKIYKGRQNKIGIFRQAKYERDFIASRRLQQETLKEVFFSKIK